MLGVVLEGAHTAGRGVQAVPGVVGRVGGAGTQGGAGLEDDDLTGAVRP